MGLSLVSALSARDAPGGDLEPSLDAELWQLAAKRSGYSPVSYLVFAAALSIYTPLGSRHSSAAVGLTLALGILVVLRIGHTTRYQKAFAANPRLHRALFGGGALASALLFSALCCVPFYETGLDETSFSGLLMLAGLAAGGTAALASDLVLVRAFAVCALAPPCVVSWLGQEAVPVPVKISLLLSLAFYFLLGGIVHQQAREGVTQARRLREQGRNLAVAMAAAEAAAVAKSQFLATMNHELRTPLNGVLGIADLLLMTSLDDEQMGHVTAQKASAESLLSLIDGVLDYSQLELGHITLQSVPFDVRKVVEEAAAAVRPLITSSNIALTVDVGAGVTAPVVGDPQRMRQVLIHLAGNAVKFTAEGQVRLTVRCIDGAAGTLRFAVEDTGIGIGAEQTDLIFGQFSQVDTGATRRYGGAGLGLAIARSLVSAMGSSIQLSSRLGVGSTFWFDLKLPPAPQESGEARTHEVSLVPPGTRVLLVDDNDLNLRVAERLLHKLQCKVTCAKDGEEACQRARAEGFDVVLMDCMMPVLDGYAATRRMLAEGLAAPVVAVTANCQPEDVIQCHQAGMRAHLAKPVRLRELAQTLERVLDEARNPRSPVVGDRVKG